MGNHDVWAKEIAEWQSSPEYASFKNMQKVIDDLRGEILKLPMGNMSISEFDFVRETCICDDDERDHRAILFYSENRFKILNAIYSKCT